MPNQEPKNESSSIRTASPEAKPSSTTGTRNELIETWLANEDPIMIAEGMYPLMWRAARLLGANRDDLNSEVGICLCFARDRYDPNLSSFRTYMAYWVKAAISRLIRAGNKAKRLISLEEELVEDRCVERDRNGDDRADAMILTLGNAILWAYYVEGKTDNEIAPEYGVSRVRIWQMRTKELEKLKGSLNRGRQSHPDSAAGGSLGSDSVSNLGK